MRGRLLVVHLFLAWTAAFAQEVAENTQASHAKCVLEGTAVDFTTAEPLPKTTIRLVPSSGPIPGYLATTDQSGHFRFEAIPAGDYDLTGERTGYLKSELGAHRPGGTGTTLHFKAGGSLTGLTVKMVRCSAITGKVVDESGEPIHNVLVYAISQNWFRGQRTYDQSEGTWTNDEGEYRIVDLPPGHYYLCAERSFESFIERQGGQEKRILGTCYPDSRTPDGAMQLELQAGQDLPGLNMRLPAGPVFHIRGKLAAKGLHDHEQRLALEAHLHNFGNGNFDLESEMNDDGTFDFSGASPGIYDFELISEEYKQTIAKVSVQVKTSDVNGLIISVPSRLALKGVVHLLNTNSEAPPRLEVFARDLDSPAMSHPCTAEVQPDGAFKFENVWPGKYVFGLAGLSGGDYVKSVQYGGREILGTAIALTSSAEQLEILVSDGAGLVDGVVQPSDSDPNVGGLQVVLASESPRLDPDGLLWTKTDQTGRFSFNKVPPGKYYALAIAEADPGLLENRDFLAKLQQDGLALELPANGNLQIRVPLVSPNDVQRALSALGL